MAALTLDHVDLCHLEIFVIFEQVLHFLVALVLHILDSLVGLVDEHNALIKFLVLVHELLSEEEHLL